MVRLAYNETNEHMLNRYRTSNSMILCEQIAKEVYDQVEDEHENARLQLG